MKETKPGTLEHLYKAKKVEIMLGEDKPATYDLEKNLGISFRAAALVRIIRLC